MTPQALHSTQEITSLTSLRVQLLLYTFYESSLERPYSYDQTSLSSHIRILISILHTIGMTRHTTTRTNHLLSWAWVSATEKSKIWLKEIDTRWQPCRIPQARHGLSPRWSSRMLMQVDAIDWWTEKRCSSRRFGPASRKICTWTRSSDFEVLMSYLLETLWTRTAKWTMVLMCLSTGVRRYRHNHGNIQDYLQASVRCHRLQHVAWNRKKLIYLINLNTFITPTAVSKTIFKHPFDVTSI